MDNELEKLVAEVTTNFKRGTTELLIMTLLSGKECYAYELSKALKEKSKGLFDIQGPSLYTALYRMEKRGFVATREEKLGRRTRIYYRLLPEGEMFLQAITQSYLSITEGINGVLSSSEGGSV